MKYALFQQIEEVYEALPEEYQKGLLIFAPFQKYILWSELLISKYIDILLDKGYFSILPNETFLSEMLYNILCRNGWVTSQELPINIVEDEVQQVVKMVVCLPIYQQFLRRKLLKSEKQKMILEGFIEYHQSQGVAIFIGLYKDGKKRKNSRELQEYWYALQGVLYNFKYILSEVKNDSDHIFWVYPNLSLFYVENNLHEQLLLISEKLWVRIKEQPFKRMSDILKLVVLEVFKNIGNSSMQINDYAKAVDAYLYMISFQEEASIKNENRDYFLPFKNLGIAYTKIHNYNKAIIFNNKALECTVDKLKIAGIHNELGSIKKELNESEQALRHYKIALDVYTAENRLLEQASVFLNMGNLYNKANELKKAFSCYKKSKNILIGLERYDRVVRVYMGLGILYEEKIKDLNKGEEYYKQGLSYAITSDNTLMQAQFIYNIGNVNYFAKNYLVALEYYWRAMSLFQSLDLAAEQGEVWQQIGNIEQVNQKFDEAIQAYQNAIDLFNIYLDVNNTIPHRIARVQYNIGAMLYHKNELESAMKYLKNALVQFEKYKDYSRMLNTQYIIMGIFFNHREQLKMPLTEIVDGCLKAYQIIPELNQLELQQYKGAVDGIEQLLKMFVEGGYKEYLEKKLIEIGIDRVIFFQKIR